MFIHLIVWVGITFAERTLGVGGMIPLLLIMGGTAGGFGTIFWALVRDTTPVPVIGLTSGLLNPAAFLGVAIYQMWTGAILDRVGRIGDLYPPAAFREAFLVCLLTVVGCVLLVGCLSRQLKGRA